MKQKDSFYMINKAQLLMFCSLLLAGCSSDSPNDTQGTTNEISIKAQVWQVMQASAPRRAQTFDNAAALQAQSGFTCTIYSANTTTINTSEITTNPDQVNWNASTWEFAHGPYHWPASGDLDFFAYMPATPPSYITDNSDVESRVTYEARNPQFKCKNLPMTNTGQDGISEFIYGLVTGQNKDNAGTGVVMTFQHPFARIKLQLAASHPNVTINSITFRGIYNNGNYNHSASPKWSTSDDATNFVLSLTGDAAVFDNNPASERQIGDYYIMIPQNWTGEIVVNADCLYWGKKKNYPSLTTTVPTNWQPGYSYTYTFNISPDDLIVNVAKFTEQW